MVDSDGFSDVDEDALLNALASDSTCFGPRQPSSPTVKRRRLDDGTARHDNYSSPGSGHDGSNAIYVSSQPTPLQPAAAATTTTQPRTVNRLRQTTLFGSGVERLPNSPANQQSLSHIGAPPEPPTHHDLNHDELSTWVYPTNLGTIRDYQFNIVQRALFRNLLVALPTGLGKTFIAAVVMLNWLRWTKKAQIVFVAPTKPLVSQQIEACLGIAGIPRTQTTMLTGGIAPGVRAEQWAAKRVFFMTPQTIVNDLKTGICDPKRIALLVVDEAHRATGGYAYVEVVKFIRRFNSCFRVLALTATPGSTVEQVQTVINGLEIAKTEIRTEHSLDIRSYVQKRRCETVLFENSEEMVLVMDLLSKALQPLLTKLTAQNAYWSKDPMSLTSFGLTQARAKWMQSDAGRHANAGIKATMHALFTVLANLAHSVTLLKYHGIGPFYHTLLAFRKATRDEKSNSKYRKMVDESEHFEKLMNFLRAWMGNADFLGHPKLEYLQNVILNHFLDAGGDEGASSEGGPSATRVMVFAHYRDSAEEIVRVLSRNSPMIRPHVFVGQSSAKGSAGMDQKQQLEIVHKFKSGVYNTLVATSIGEEGLDIGEIDLIICYDSSASPIRMLQRMGRTGRKRAGNVILLLMKGKEERDSTQASDSYMHMQELIASGARFNYHEDKSRRILPREIVPMVDKRVVEIPIENTQQSDLPVPKASRGRPPKRPPKKFHMPDGVDEGFVMASKLDGASGGGGGSGSGRHKSTSTRPKNIDSDPLEPLPPLKDILLTRKEEQELSQNYQFVYGDDDESCEVESITLDKYPLAQRTLQPTRFVEHGPAARAISNLHKVGDAKLNRWRRLGESSEMRDLIQGDHETGSKIDESHDPEPTTPATTKPRRARRLPPGKARQPNAGGRSKHSLDSRFDGAALEAAEVGPESSPPATPIDMRVLSQAISLGSSTTPPASQRNGAWPSDDKPNSSMVDFVVDDTASLSVVHSDRMPDSSLPPLDSILTNSKKQSRRKAAKVTLSDLVASSDSSRHGSPGSEVACESGNSPSRVASRANKRRRRVIDNSSP